jgi:beta-lactamase superfamily II metal-dependent hydrolase
LDFELLEALNEKWDPGVVTALLLPEGGYAPLNPPEWLHRLNPQLVVISVSADAYQEVPSPETLEALAGYPVLRTDHNGWVKVVTDGEEMWVIVEKQ